MRKWRIVVCIYNFSILWFHQFPLAFFQVEPQSPLKRLRCLEVRQCPQWTTHTRPGVRDTWGTPATISTSVSEWEFLFYVLQLHQQLPLSFVIIFSLFIAPTAPPPHSPSSLASSCQCFPVFDASSHLVFLSVTVLCECQKLTPLTWKTCIMNGRPFLCVSLSHQSNWKTSPWLKGRSWLWFFRLSMIGNHKEWSCHVHTAGKISQSPNLFADICDLNLIF